MTNPIVPLEHGHKLYLDGATLKTAYEVKTFEVDGDLTVTGAISANGYITLIEKLPPDDPINENQKGWLSVTDGEETMKIPYWA